MFLHAATRQDRSSKADARPLIHQNQLPTAVFLGVKTGSAEGVGGWSLKKSFFLFGGVAFFLVRLFCF
jgi:hypothetical protein